MSRSIEAKQDRGGAPAACTFSVGDRYRVSIVLVFGTGGVPIGINAEWDPDVPSTPLTPAELADYRRGRDRVLDDLAKRYGVRLAVLDA